MDTVLGFNIFSLDNYCNGNKYKENCEESLASIIQAQLLKELSERRIYFIFLSSRTKAFQKDPI
jgi:hypothetical protein